MLALRSRASETPVKTTQNRPRGAPLSHRLKAAFAAAVAVLAVPASASAATKTVDMGTPTAQGQKAFQKAPRRRQRLLPARDDDPRRRLDQVRADRASTTSTSRARAARRLRADPADRPDVAGVNDAAGAPFWFNGAAAGRLQPEPRSSRALRQEGDLHRRQAASSPGCRWRRSRSRSPSSSPRPGTYTYYCDVHPGMKGTVKVVVQDEKIPTRKGRQGGSTTQVASALKTAKRLAHTRRRRATTSSSVRRRRRRRVLRLLPGQPDRHGGHDGDVPDDVEVLEVHTATSARAIRRPSRPPTSARSPRRSRHRCRDPRRRLPERPARLVRQR